MIFGSTYLEPVEHSLVFAGCCDERAFRERFDAKELTSPDRQSLGIISFSLACRAFVFRQLVTRYSIDLSFF
jgi:hypothetical protein